MTQSAQITTVAELNKAIDVWGRKGATWAKEGHKLALLALDHLAKHGDIGPVNRLYCAMPKGSKSSSMAQWLMSYASVRPNEDAADKAKPFVYAKDKKCDMEAAAKTPWFEFRPEPTPLEMFDVLPAIENILKRARAAQNVQHAELLEGLQGLLDMEKELTGEGDEGEGAPAAKAEPPAAKATKAQAKATKAKAKAHAS